jgi:arylsulfatase A-like enzyme
LAARFFYEPPTPQHAAEKAEFLRSIPRIDPATAPNLVVILYDDLGSGDLSIQGNRLIRTPRLDSLASDGMRMTQFYSASPVCTPSRAALLSGRYPIRNGTNHHVFFAEEQLAATLRKMLGAVNELPRDEILLPEVLAAAGYATGMVGKWHLGAIDGHQPMDFGFDEYFGVLYSNDMQPLHLYRGRSIEERDETERGWFGHPDEDSGRALRGVDQSRFTRRFTDEAIAFLERHRDDRFFLYLAYTAPHVPHYPDPDHAGRSAGGPYGDVVEDLDRGTGAVLDALERLGLDERTLVIVTSDNGPDYEGSAGPLRGRKQETYEGGMRVPMLVRWPGRIPAGASSDAMAMNIDLFPTLLSLVGIPLPGDRTIDGADLAATWFEGAPSPHDHLFYFPTIGSEPEAVRDARYKYRRKTGQEFRSKPHLSDLELDAEAHNLAKTHPEAADRLRAALDAMAASVRDDPRGWR